MRNVVYSCDDNYIRQTIVSIVSLLESNHHPFNVWIISDDIRSSNRDLIIEMTKKFQTNIIFLEIEEILGGIVLARGQRHPRTIYAKLFLEDIIKADKLLFLDSDTVINDDLSDLWIRTMQEELIAGVRMPYSDLKKESMNITSSVPYICDGIVMINLDLWRKNKIGNACKTYINHYNGNPPMMSEGTLNYVCQHKIGVLPPKFNLMSFMIMYSMDEINTLFKVNDYYTKFELAEARKHPIIIHYIKELYNRPWFEPCDHPHKGVFRDKYESLFLENEYEFCDLEKHTKITRLLFRNLPFNVFAFLYHFKERIRKNYEKDNV